MTRVDTASRLIPAPAGVLYAAFAEQGAMERWLPPSGMVGEMLHFDFRDGGSYRMRLRYRDPGSGRGKTSDDADDVEVRLTKIEAGRLIEQAVTFESDDPAFAGVMRMTWTFQPEASGTLVTVRAEDVPEGIRASDHEAAMAGSLENLARYAESREGPAG